MGDDDDPEDLPPDRAQARGREDRRRIIPGAGLGRQRLPRRRDRGRDGGGGRPLGRQAEPGPMITENKVFFAALATAIVGLGVAAGNDPSSFALLWLIVVIPSAYFF